MSPRTSAFLLATASIAIAASGFAAEPAKAETRRVVADEEYKASGWHQFWFGKGYRDLWAMPVDVPVLDLKAEAGGLNPVRQIGGYQTPGLAFKGGDGRAYTFRNLIKHPERILPPEWRDTVPAGIFRDQMSAGHPGVAPIFSHLARSVGIIYETSRLAVMPDDPSLGEFRKTFANQVGTFDSYPSPGTDGITEIVGSQEFWLKWLASPQNRADSRQFLKARLLDLATGNWDRHRNQWRWARVQGKPLWQPVPEDPDQCFTLYGGVAIGFVRNLQPKLMEYSGEYPGRIEGLTYNNGDVNRWLLSAVEWPVYEEVAKELQAQLTDALIDEAMQQVPAEWYQKRGAEMAAALRQRRDGLLDYARKFYEHLADRVDVRGSNADEIARVTRGADGTVEVALSTARSDGSESEPFFKRRFSPKETDEIRVYLHGGNDKLLKSGEKGGITVRVLGGPGDDTLDDSKSGKAELRDFEGRNVFLEGPGTNVREGVWTNPVELKDGTWIEPRSYGHWTAPIAELWWQPNQEFIIGGGLTRTTWAFRKSPWATQQRITALYSTGYKNFRLAYAGQRRLTAKSVVARLDLNASAIENNNYYGFGNDTEELSTDLYRTETNTLSAFPSLRLEPSRKALVFLGAELKGVNSTKDEESLVEQEQPYGAGQFGEIALRAGFEFDSRNRLAPAAGLTPAEQTAASDGHKVTGVRLTGEGFYMPKALDVEEGFGGVEGDLAAYVGNRTISLAARVGGRTLFGRYPWFESAFIGGSHSVRAYRWNRFRGDSSLYGNLELRLWSRATTPILPIRLGLVAYADSGRVWYEGEESDTWHSGFGGGLLGQLIGMPMLFSFTAAAGDEGTRINFLMGYSF
jgi:hypothetical protein